MHFRDLSLSPPGQFKYTQPESGLTLSALTFPSLLKKIIQHRANMGYVTVGRLSEEIEDAICRALSPEDQAAHCDNGIRTKTSVHWSEVASFLKTAASWFVSGRQLVEQGEAERRASICVTCPYNVPLSGCGVCKSTLAELRKGLLDRSTPYDDQLKACSVCGCENSTQVHVPLETLAAGAPHTFPIWCWKASLNQ